MNKRKMIILLTVLMLTGGCTSTSGATVNQANANAVLAVLTLPFKIVGAAVAAAVGAAVGMGVMP